MNRGKEVGAARGQTNEQEGATVARAAIRKALPALDEYDLVRLTAFVDLLQATKVIGMTPIEDFITKLPFDWVSARDYGQALTLDDIVESINGREGYRSRFNDMIRIAQYVNRYYPELAEKSETAVLPTQEEIQ